MSWTVHQNKTSSPAAQTTSTAITFDSTTTTGRSILVLIAGNHVSGYDVAASSPVTDNKSNTYTEIADTGLFGSSRNRLMAFVCHDATGGASHAVTVNHLQTTNNIVALAIIEFSATGEISTDRVGTSYDDTSPVSTTATASGANTTAAALVFGFGAWQNADVVITGTLDGDFTSLFASISSTDYRMNGHAGYYTASGTETSAFTSAVGATNTALGALVLTFAEASAAQKYLKLLAHASAASATSVAGVVFNAPGGTDICGERIGEFTGEAFEASLESGQAVLKVPVADFGGTSLTTASVPVACVRTASYTTGIVACTVIEE